LCMKVQLFPLLDIFGCRSLRQYLAEISPAATGDCTANVTDIIVIFNAPDAAARCALLDEWYVAAAAETVGPRRNLRPSDNPSAPSAAAAPAAKPPGKFIHSRLGFPVFY
jgi:hypothetical protein